MYWLDVVFMFPLVVLYVFSPRIEEVDDVAFPQCQLLGRDVVGITYNGKVIIL